MSVSKEKRNSIINQIIDAVFFDRLNVTEIAETNSISRTSVYSYLKKLMAENVIKRSDSGKYILLLHELTKEYEREGLDEHNVWRGDIVPFLGEVPKKAMDATAYIFCEILNNAIDHSESKRIRVSVAKNKYIILFVIQDFGIGIFENIRQALDLPEKRFAILELAKGKFTSDPQKHSGEGIFFSSRVAQRFFIISDELIFCGQEANDILDEIQGVSDDDKGTFVFASVMANTDKDINDVFHKYTQYPDDYGFSKTRVPVRLLAYGDDSAVLTSRSQAKRLLAGFERFEKIELDFEGVEAIMQGFADEVFRVFPSMHPQCSISYSNCNQKVEYMIKHVLQTER